MHEVRGIVLFALVLLVAAYAFSPRAVPPFPATGVAVDSVLLLAAARAGDRVVAAGERGRVFVSDDQGRTWRHAKTPTQSTLTAVYFRDAQHGWAVGHDAVILRTLDGGETWEQTHFAPDAQKPLLDVWFETSERGYAVGAYGSFYETIDAGASWHPRKVFEDDRHLNALVKAADGKLFIAGEAGALQRSVDRGRHWEALVTPYKGSFFGILGAKDGGVVAFGLRGKVFRSGDSGETWQPVDTGTHASLMGGSVLDDDSMVLVGQDGTMLSSRDHGRSFAQQNRADGKTIAAAVPVGSQALLLFGDSGVARAALPGQ